MGGAQPNVRPPSTPSMNRKRPLATMLRKTRADALSLVRLRATQNAASEDRLATHRWVVTRQAM